MKIYILFCAAFALTTLVTHWGPGLLKAEVGESYLFYTLTSIFWLILAALFAPLLAIYIIKTNNDEEIIKQFAEGLRRGRNS